MDKLKILFRTAGGKKKNLQLGLGHVYRCINLAQNLPKSAQIYFLIEDFGGVKEILREYGFRKIFLLKNNVPVDDDIKQTLSLIKNENINTIIIDRYNTSVTYVKEIRKTVKTVVITDLKNIQYSADLVINGFIGFDNNKIKNRYGTTCLVGPAFQILNKNFAQKKAIPNKRYTILATFGGLDEQNITKILLKCLSKYIKKMKATIILGPIATQLDLKSLQNRYGKNLRILQKTNALQKEISKACFGFCSGGITTYEFASMNVPFFIICDDKH
ncbi:MAG: hypothetical protein QXE82_05745, partial [Candidatus Nitrosotenuis sp.]